MTAVPRFRIGVFAVVHDAGRVLLARRRDSGWWNLPGGGLERGETVDEGTVREVLEETELVVTVERLIGVYSKPQAEEVVLTFACRVVGGELAETDESTEFGWWPPDQLPERTLPKHIERVQDWAAGVTDTLIKAQRSPSLRA
ncbi:MAG: NUDIX hydrolase [Chloroflexota bacterium]